MKIQRRSKRRQVLSLFAAAASAEPRAAQVSCLKLSESLRDKGRCPLQARILIGTGELTELENGLFSSRADTLRLIAAEEERHRQKSNTDALLTLGVWKGSTLYQVQEAIANRRLTDELVALSASCEYCIGCQNVTLGRWS